MIEYYLGFDSDYILLGLAGFTVVLLIIILINVIQMSKLKKKYKMFMDGKNAKTLEESIMSRMDQIDYLISSNQKNENDIKKIFHNMKNTFQKFGLIKYDAFQEMIDGNSVITLGEEEKEALEMAMNYTTTNSKK